MSTQQFCFWHLTAYIPLLPSPTSLGCMLSVFAHIFVCPKMILQNISGWNHFSNVCVYFGVFFIWYLFIKYGFVFTHKQLQCKCFNWFYSALELRRYRYIYEFTMSFVRGCKVRIILSLPVCVWERERGFVKENCGVIMCECVCLCVFLYGGGRVQ